jgi:hypothetical protein
MQDRITPRMLRWDEAIELLKSVDDLTTSQLMNMAIFQLVAKSDGLEKNGVTDFDVLFFMELMLGFCRQHDRLKRILGGEDLRAWTDELEKD